MLTKILRFVMLGPTDTPEWAQLMWFFLSAILFAIPLAYLLIWLVPRSY